MGGLENIVLTLINELPADRFQHVVYCLTTFDPEFRKTIRHQDVEVIALDKRPGNDPMTMLGLARRLRALGPDIFHSHNLGPMEGQWAAALAGVPYRVHAEHGRDTYDLDGTSFKYNLLRRATRPLIHQYIAVSKDLADWFVSTIHVPRERVRQIYTGIDTERFSPGPRLAAIEGAPAGFFDDGNFVVGTVGRLAEVKDQATLIDAFALLRKQLGDADDSSAKLRLLIVGEGAMRPVLESRVASHGLEGLAWLTGNRTDIPQLLRQMDVYTLPSTIEGISISILEAMSAALPVVATNVGGNPELVLDQPKTGFLVPAADPASLADSIGRIWRHRAEARAMGAAAREIVMRQYSLAAMLGAYSEVYLQSATND